jgi:hypothetical protein
VLRETSSVRAISRMPFPCRLKTGSELYGLALEDYDTVNNLTLGQKSVAQFWADNPGQTGTPRGHWIDITRQISQREPLDLGRSAELSHESASPWRTPSFDVGRLSSPTISSAPVTYINDKLTVRGCRSWSPQPFPEYTSGHSTQSGAASVVLTDMLGDDYAFVDTTLVDHGSTPALPSRSFSSFDSASKEARYRGSWQVSTSAPQMREGLPKVLALAM